MRVGGAAAAIIIAVSTAAVGGGADSVEVFRYVLMLLIPVAIVLAGFLLHMCTRLCRVRENRNEWVRICCGYRRGLRDRIDKREFEPYFMYTVAMDRMDREEQRKAERNKDGINDRDANDAMPM